MLQWKWRWLRRQISRCDAKYYALSTFPGSQANFSNVSQLFFLRWFLDKIAVDVNSLSSDMLSYFCISCRINANDVWRTTIRLRERDCIFKHFFNWLLLANCKSFTGWKNGCELWSKRFNFVFCCRNYLNFVTEEMINPYRYVGLSLFGIFQWVICLSASTLGRQWCRFKSLGRQ